VLEAAADAPADAYGLHALASYCMIYREGKATYAPGASVMVANFADVARRLWTLATTVFIIASEASAVMDSSVGASYLIGPSAAVWPVGGPGLL
jgi:hypothetical protein